MSPYKLIKLGNFQMSITSSKISFGTQFKAHIGANHAARHLRLQKLGNKQKKEKAVQSIRVFHWPSRESGSKYLVLQCTHDYVHTCVYTAIRFRMILLQSCGIKIRWGHAWGKIILQIVNQTAMYTAMRCTKVESCGELNLATNFRNSTVHVKRMHVLYLWEKANHGS